MQIPTTLHTNTFMSASMANLTPDEWAENDKRVAEWERTQNEQKYTHRFENCGLGKKYLPCRFSNFRTEIKKQVELLAAGRVFSKSAVSGNWSALVMFGPNGTGKTHIAAAILHDIIFSGRSGYYTTSEALRARLHRAESFTSKETQKDIMDELTAYSVVVIDEIGRETTKTVEESNTLFAAIDTCYQNGVPVAIISNYTREQLNMALGAAAVSRLSQVAIWMDTSGIPDQRQKQ